MTDLSYLNKTAPGDHIDQWQRILIDLQNGSREPQNDFESQVLKEIKEIENAGATLDVPGEFF